MRVGRVVDLTVPLDAATPVVPGDPPVRVRPALRIAEDGVAVTALALGSHSGTHVDAPGHVLAGGAGVDALPWDRLLAPAVVVDVTGLPAGTTVGPERLAAAVGGRLDVLAGVAVLLRTGWDRFRGGNAYTDHPVLAPAAARLLLDAGVRTLGVDAPSVDLSGPGAAPGLPVHHLLAEAGAVAVENLAGLERVDFPDPLFSALPLRLPGGDGSPVRAVAAELLA